MVALEKSPESIDDLAELARALESMEFGASVGDLSEQRDALLETVRQYLIPRRAGQAPRLTVVFAGPTGSGKSTLVNSLARRALSATGPLRPTTRGPIALIREEQDELVIGGVEVAQVRGKAQILDAMTLIDTPDIDSTAVKHRAMAEAMIDHADVVVFVTSALRYADEAPWQVLRRAQSRGATVVNVLNRLTPESAGAAIDFRGRLEREGLDGDGLVVISEHHIESERERVPSLAVRSLARVLAEIARDSEQHRDEISSRVLATVVSKARLLADAVDESGEALESLEAEIDLSLNSRPQRLEWPANVAVTFPRRARRWAGRRWVKRPGHEKLADTHAHLLISAVQSDLMSWAVNHRPTQVSVDDATVAVDAAASLIESAVYGWRDSLGDVVLLEPADQWREAARRSLMARVEVVYQQVSQSVIERARFNWRALGSDPIRQTLRPLVDA